MRWKRVEEAQLPGPVFSITLKPPLQPVSRHGIKKDVDERGNKHAMVADINKF
jgi:hypothetical protein